jgi:hypothetical protein
MKRAILIIGLLIPQWLIGVFVPPVANEFRIREYGITNYPGWSDGELKALAFALAMVGHGTLVWALWLFCRSQPRGKVAHQITWLAFFVTLLGNVVSAVMIGVIINVGVAISCVGLYLIFSRADLRFFRLAGQSNASSVSPEQ